MDMNIIAASSADGSGIFDIASRVSNPLALSGFLAAAFFLIVNQILGMSQLFREFRTTDAYNVIVLIIKKLFLLALIALIFGFVGYIVLLFQPMLT
jgi:hypothetical protein